MLNDGGCDPVAGLEAPPPELDGLVFNISFTDLKPIEAVAAIIQTRKE